MRAPPSGDSATQILPPCASTIDLAIARPRPLPPDLPVSGEPRCDGSDRTRGPAPRRDPAPVVVDEDPQPAAGSLGTDSHHAAASGVVDRVAQEIAHHLGKLIRVGAEHARGASGESIRRSAASVASTSSRRKTSIWTLAERRLQSFVDAGPASEEVVNQALHAGNLAQRQQLDLLHTFGRVDRARAPAPRAGRGSRSAACAARARRPRRTRAGARTRPRAGRACGRRTRRADGPRHAGHGSRSGA